MRILLLAPLALALSGCIAKTAVDVVTLPVKAASKTVDVLTTSEAEADQKRGRALREYEECIGKADRRAQKSGEAPDYRKCKQP